MQLFSGFNLTITPEFFGSDFEELSSFKGLYKQEESVKNSICGLIRKDSLTASQISNEWFPDVKVDVFISHSHADKNLANALAGWLYKFFRIKAFVDSHFWSYAGDLLKEINDQFSNKRDDPNGGILYSHKKCIKASEHVNILLNAALHKMIDRTEAVFFLNTKNSIEVFNNYDQEIYSTYSPWIFSEILCTQLIRKKPLYEYRPKYRSFKHADSDELLLEKSDFVMPYEVSLDHLEEISENELNKWRHMDHSKFLGYPLDGLYSISKDYSRELRYTRETIAEKNGIDPSDFLFS